PAVALTSPADNAVDSGTLSLIATPTDNGAGVDHVDFFVGTTLVGTDSQPNNGWSVSYNTTNAATSLNGDYAWNAKAYDKAANNASSSSFTIKVRSCQSPSITSQPQNVNVCLGGSATFSVAAGVTNGDPLAYQWQKGGVDIAGATSSSYTIASVVAGDVAGYTVKVTDTPAGGSCSLTTTSRSASLSLVASQTVTGASNTVISPDQASSAGVQDNTAITVKNPATVTVTGITTRTKKEWSASYNTTTAATSLNDDYAWNAKTDDKAANNASSSTFTIKVRSYQSPRITGQPQNVNVCLGGSATFSVAAGVTN